MAVWGRKCSGMSQEEVDALQLKIALKQEQHLIPLKEDLADWLNKTLEVDDITASNFMDKLDNGVICCRLARLIQRRAEDCERKGLVTEPVPSVRFKCWENAKSESFYARDNADNFIRWCRKFGVHEAVIFESDGLVLHTQPRTVVLCLLELGRIASKYSIEPPGLVQLEKEIEQEEQSSGLSSNGSSLGSASPVIPRSRTESTLSLNSGLLSPDSGIMMDHFSNMRPTRNKNGNNRLSYTPPSSNEKIKTTPQQNKPASELDKKVMKIAKNVCKDVPTQITRISEGKYCIGGKNVFVRLLKGRHVMVRVGGGWDTLEHFLSRHEPCQVIVVNRKPPPTSLAPDDEYISLACSGSPADSFLHIRAKYKGSPLHRSAPATPEFRA